MPRLFKPLIYLPNTLQNIISYNLNHLYDQFTENMHGHNALSLHTDLCARCEIKIVFCMLPDNSIKNICPNATTKDIVYRTNKQLCTVIQTSLLQLHVHKCECVV